MCVHTGARFERRAVSRERSRDHRHRFRVAGLLEQGDRRSECRPDCLQVTADRTWPSSQGMDGTEQATQIFFPFSFFFSIRMCQCPMDGHMLFSSGLVPSGDDHVQAGDHGRSHMGPRRTPGRLHHCGTPPC